MLNKKNAKEIITFLLVNYIYAEFSSIIQVSGGSFSYPYYEFNPSFEFEKGKTYG
tara:strand:+ start:325 stop:489 length:165 start_codon:yes stop_codon:yes gene_type:complete